MKYLYLLVGVLSFSSCSKILFTEPMPIGEQNLEKFPKSMIGEYIHPINAIPNIEIKPQGISTPKLDDGYNMLGLSDSVVLRKMDDYYVLSIQRNKKKDRKNSHWDITLLKTVKGKNLKIIQLQVAKDFLIDSLLENYNGSIIKERNKDNDVRKESGDENARALPVDDELCECLDKANSDEEMIECQPEYTLEELESIRSEECSSDSFGPKELLLEVNNKQFNDLLKNKNLTYSFIMENVKNNN